MDILGFKKIMFIITCIEILIGSNLYFMVNIGIIYIIEILFTASCIGGTFAIITPGFIKVFGLYVGPELYGLTGISIGIANLLGPFLTMILNEGDYSFLIAFLIGVAFCIIKLVVLFFFDENQKMYDDVDKNKKDMNFELTNNSSNEDSDNENFEKN